MGFFERLQKETEAQRQHMMQAPLINAVPAGRFDLDGYVCFLRHAYHHVKHTVPLMMACGSRLPESNEHVRKALVEYIEEEYGHHEWILNDIEACGYDKEAVRAERPGRPIELMVAFLYDQINRGNPMAFFGMVMVLEGTSIKLATMMGKLVQMKLQLPNKAFSYLFSHGDLDKDHFIFFQNLMNSIEAKADQDAIIHSANMVFQLYSEMLYSLPVLEEKKSDAAA